MRTLNFAAAGLAFLVLRGLSVAAPEGSNLLLNPSFEEAGEGHVPSHWRSDCSGGSTAGRVTGVAHTGIASGHLVKVADGRSHVAALVFPRIEVQGGAEYTLSGWGKGQVQAGQANLFLYQYDRENRWLGNYFVCPVPARAERWMPLHCTDRVRPDCAWVQVLKRSSPGPSAGFAGISPITPNGMRI